MDWIHNKKKGEPFIPENYITINENTHYSQAPLKILKEMFGVKIYFTSGKNWSYRVQERIQNIPDEYSAFIYQRMVTPATTLNWEDVKYTWHHDGYWLNQEEYEVIVREINRCGKDNIKSLSIGYVCGLEHPIGMAGSLCATKKPGYDLILHIKVK